MEKLQKLQTSILTPTTIDDGGELLIKQIRTSGMESNTAINKIMKNFKENNKETDGRLVALEEKTLAMTDLTDTDISAPSSLQVLQYGSGKWENKTPPPKTVSFCFVYPATNQYSPYYKFRSNKKITGITVMAITAPSSQISINVYKSGANIFSQWFTGQHTQYSANVDVSADELCFAYISGSPNGANLLTVELTVVDR